MEKQRKGSPVRSCLLASALVLGGGLAPAGAADGGGGELKRVNVGALNNLMHLPTFIAVEKGLFVRQGVDAKLKVLSTGPEGNKAFLAGETDYTQIGSVTAFTVGERAAIPRILFVLQGDATRRHADTQFAIVARSAAGIRAGHPEDLAGKTLAAAVGGTSDQYFELVLAGAGVPPEKIRFRNMRPGDMLGALRAGHIDAFSIWEPISTFALKTVPGAVLVTRGGGHLGYFIFYVALPRTLRRDPPLARAIVRAYMEAMQMARREPEVGAEIATRWIPGLTEDVAREALRHLRFDPRVSQYTIADAKESGEIVKAQGKVRHLIDIREALDLSFLEEVQREAPEFFRDLPPLPPEARP